MPVSVLESAAYLGLSANARSLLFEVALQFHGDDNGRLLLSRAYLKTRGWRSSDMIDKGKRELLDAELIFETVKGHRPNKASWYAMTWRRLDKIPGFDHGVEKAFEQGAYKRKAQRVDVTKLKGYQKANDHPLGPINGAVLSPAGGTAVAAIAPPRGTESPPPVPPCGPIRTAFEETRGPPDGHPLEKPSAAAAFDLGGRPEFASAKPARTQATAPAPPNSKGRHLGGKARSPVRCAADAGRAKVDRLDVPLSHGEFAD